MVQYLCYQTIHIYLWKLKLTEKRKKTKEFTVHLLLSLLTKMAGLLYCRV